jgi:hypothetical protein
MAFEELHWGLGVLSERRKKVKMFIYYVSGTDSYYHFTYITVIIFDTKELIGVWQGREQQYTLWEAMPRRPRPRAGESHK